MTRGSRRNGNGARVAQAAVALGLVLVGSGCAAFTPGFKPSYTINVEFTDEPGKGLCARWVDTLERNCDAGRPRDCLRVQRGEKVTFQAVDAATKRPIDKDFEVRFAPFKEGAIVSSAGVTKPLTIDGPANRLKPYRFNVHTASQPACPVVDPQIIIEH